MTLPTAPARRGAQFARLRMTTCLALLVALLAVTLSILSTPAAANPPMTHDPVGKLEHATAVPGGFVRLQGWAADPDASANARVFGLVDGVQSGSTSTSVVRPKITKRNATGPTPGFDFDVAVPSTGVHTVCAAVTNIGPGIARVLGCVTVPLGTKLTSAQLATHDPSGVVSTAAATSATFEVTGWGAEPDFRVGRMVVVLYVDGQPVKTVDTHAATTTQRAAGAGKRGSFDITVPVSPGAHIGCVWAVNTGLGANSLLGCLAADTRGAAGHGVGASRA